MRPINALSAERSTGVELIPFFKIPHETITGEENRQTFSAVAAIQAPVSTPNTSEVIQNFEGMSNVNGVLPPDPNGDVGPDHYIQMINVSFAIWDKEGNLLYGPALINTLFSGVGGVCETENRGDPIVLYDEEADRWLMSQFAFDDTGAPDYDPAGPYHQCIAISTSGDPLGTWYRYDFVINNTKLNDYAKFGVWQDGYYMSVNQYTQPSFSWGGAGVVAFERDEMLNGNAAQMVYFDLYGVDPTLGGLLPADFDGVAPPVGTPNYFMQFDDDAWGYSPDQLRIYEFNVDWDNPGSSTFTLHASLSTDAFDSNMCNYSRDCIPQPGTTQGVDAISDRLMYRLQYRNFGSYEAMVANHTVDVGGDTAGIRWYELRDTGAGWTIYQQATHSPDNTNRWMGSIAMDIQGNIALGYSASSSTVQPSIWATGRVVDDPIGTMQSVERVIVDGLGRQTHSSGRWGDYSMLAVDPFDNCTFWYTQEYYSAPSSYSFRTRIAAFKFQSCNPSPATWFSLGNDEYGDGPFSGGGSVNDIHVDADGDIYVAGSIRDAGGVDAADVIVMWDGSNWNYFGQGISSAGAISGWANAVEVDDSGHVYVGGNLIADDGGDLVYNLAMWDGDSWESVGACGLNAYDLIIDSSGDLYVAGDFTNACGIAEADYIAKWDGADWSAIGSNGGGNGALNGIAYALDIDSNGNLYVGGDFTNAAGIATADRIAVWDGNAWSNLGDNGAGDGALADTVRVIRHDGADNVFVGGEFVNAGGDAEADYLATWNGVTWDNIGDNGAGDGAFDDWVRALGFDMDGILYAGGRFSNVNGDPEISRISVWNGSSWGAVGNNGAGNPAFSGEFDAIDAIAFAANGDLIVGGYFDNAGGNAQADEIAGYSLLDPLTFADVPFSHPLYPYIEALWDAGFTAGCQTDPLTFCPDTILDRAQSGVFILRGQLGVGYTPPGEPWDTFQDDWSGSDISWAEKWAEGMWEEGLTAGCQNSPELLYCPRSLLPRVEAAVFGLRLLHGSGYTPPAASGTVFADMTDTDYWGTKWAEQAYADGLLPACGSTGGKPLFCPDDEMSRAWAAYMIVVAKDLPLP